MERRKYTACYTLVSVLVLGTGTGSGQYYCILDIGWLSWYRSNPIPISATFMYKLICVCCVNYMMTVTK